jgi:hypothetical protein
VAVRYTPGGDGRSRLAGNVNWIALLSFTLAFSAVFGTAFRLWKEGRRGYYAPRPSKRKRRRY